MKHEDGKPFYSRQEAQHWHVDGCIAMVEREIKRVYGLNRKEAREYLRARVLSKPCKRQKPEVNDGNSSAESNL